MDEQSLTSEQSIQVLGVLKDVWGYDSLRSLQADSIGAILNRRDSLTVLPTGGGKSLCFQVPALCRSGMAVVVSPLISLMKDQVDSLKACGVDAAYVNSTQDTAEQRAVANDIENGKTRLLYVAPERLLTQRMLDFLSKTGISFFAIDEAHCVSSWGHDFRPEYRGLRTLRERFSDATVHAFTATASERVRDDIVQQLGLNRPKMFVGSFDRPNLVYRMLRSEARLQQVSEVIQRHRDEAGIVYCISRKEVERTSRALNEMRIRALPYHAGMSDADRKANQEAFINERSDVIVATIAFGMGIDKSNVRFVIHAGMPKSVENYQQESGRAGRDGLDAECVLLYSGADVVTWRKIMEMGGASPDAAAFRSLDSMHALCTGIACRHRSLVEYFGEKYTAENCGACDVCLGEIETVDDPVTVGQKILSCVLRLQERFGAAYTAKVLAGSQDQRIKEFGHDQLSTYGLLSEEGQAVAKMWIEQMISQGFIVRSGEYQTLNVTESGRRLLKRDGVLHLSAAPKRKTGHSSKNSASEVSWEGTDRGLFDHLRSLRSQIASERSVPAYIVFGDATLRDLARVRPSDLHRFSKIKGVGTQKLSDFGDTFVTAINEYCKSNGVELDQESENAPITAIQPQQSEPINPSSMAAFDLFRAGKSVEEVAGELGRAPSTVNGYLSDFLRHEQIVDPSPWVDKATINRIDSALHVSEDGRLKPIYEYLGGAVPYEAIRIVVTCRRHSSGNHEDESDEE